VDFELDPQWKRPGLDLMRADGRRLPFRDGVFDALYCYHVLEHVPGPERAVAEARRVLAKGGIAFFGTPNKSRLIGYAGGRAKAWDKVRWNLVDWGKRLSGRWANEKGAHAGFSGGELSRMLARSFSRVEAMSLSYYESKYPRLKALWNTSFRLGVGRFLAPSVYFRATDEDGAGRD
jgi:SAM-dependent methyltransferase